MQDNRVYTNSTRSISVKISPAVHQAIKFYALENNLTIQRVIEKVLHDFVEEEGFLHKRYVKKKVSKK